MFTSLQMPLFTKWFISWNYKSDNKKPDFIGKSVLPFETKLEASKSIGKSNFSSLPDIFNCSFDWVRFVRWNFAIEWIHKNRLLPPLVCDLFPFLFGSNFAERCSGCIVVTYHHDESFTMRTTTDMNWTLLLLPPLRLLLLLFSRNIYNFYRWKHLRLHRISHYIHFTMRENKSLMLTSTSMFQVKYHSMNGCILPCFGRMFNHGPILFVHIFSCLCVFVCLQFNGRFLFVWFVI